jgi:hypothetical protein
MMSHPKEYGVMQANAKKYVEKNYQWKDIMRKFDETIETIVGKT